MARRFHFGLEAVRKLRERAQDAQQRVVAQAQLELVEVQERKSNLEARLRESTASIRLAQDTGRLDLSAIRELQVHRGWLQREWRVASEELEARRQVLNAERAKLAESVKQKKVIDKVRERRWQQHQAGARREEQGITDEVAVQGFARRLAQKVDENRS